MTELGFNLSGFITFVATNVKGGLQSVKYDLLTEYLTLFSFVMLVNECKPEFQFKRSLKNAKFGQCLYLVSRLCYEQSRCAERTVTPLQGPSYYVVFPFN